MNSKYKTGHTGGLFCIVLLAVGFYISVFGFSHIAYAQADQLGIPCSALPKESLAGSLNVPKGSYTVYAHLDRRGEHALVQALMCGPDSADATTIVSVKANGDSWTKLGTIQSRGGSYMFGLESNAFTEAPNAYRPSVLLVPADHPPCQPTTQCTVKIDNETGYVNPAGSLLNDDFLHVMRVQDPKTDTVVDVRYYVDSDLVYTTKGLEPFDLRYAFNPGQSLARVIRYASGQEVVLSSKVPYDYHMSISGFIAIMMVRYPLAFAALALMLGVPLFVIIHELISMMVIRRHGEYSHHATTRSKNIPNYVRTWWTVSYWLKKLRPLWLVLFSLAVVASIWIGVTTYMLDVFTVNGISMNKNYYTGDRLLINKLPVTFANLSGHEYIPNRGDVVIARAVFGNTGELTENPGYIVKRVIGLPGERIVVKNGKMTIFNDTHPNGFDLSSASWSKNVVPNLPSEDLDITLGRSELFLTGDNRPESVDSRTNGPIETREIVGSVISRIYTAKHNSDGSS